MPDAVYLIAAACLAAVVTAVATWLFSRRKNEAETYEITDRIARGWIEELRAEVANLRTEIATLKANNARDVATLVNHIGVLETHITTGQPPPPPSRPTIGL